MRKLLYATICCLMATVFWQCNDDADWKEGAIGTLSPMEINFTKDGGSQTIKFNTTTGWSASVEYSTGAEANWVTLSSTKGNSGESELTITTTGNNTYTKYVAKVTVDAGGAKKIYTVTVMNKTEISPDAEVLGGISHEGDTVGIPVHRNIECYLSVPSDVNWIKQIQSKIDPIADTLWVVVSPYTSGLEERMASVVLYNDNFNLHQEVVLIQKATPLLSIAPNKLTLEGNAQTDKSVKVRATADWTLTLADGSAIPAGSWYSFNATSGKIGEANLEITVSETLMETREESFTFKADTMVRTFTLKQYELGVANGALAYKPASMATYKPTESYMTTVINTEESTIDMFRIYSASAASKMNGAGGAPWDLSGVQTPAGPVSQRVVFNSACNSITLSCCTWGDANKNANGFGGEMTCDIYLWNTDYATTVAAKPIASHFAEYNDSGNPQLLASGTVIPAGEYLIELSSSHKYAGLWYSGSSTNTNFKEVYIRGNKEDRYPNFEIKFAASTQPGYCTSKDEGETWGSMAPISELTMDMGSTGSNLKVTKGADGYYYASYKKADGIAIARSKSLKAGWMIWSGIGTEAWVAPGKSTTTFEGQSASVVANAKGDIYVCTLKEDRIAVTELNTESTTWVYTFLLGASVPSSVDMKLLANGNYELLWVDGYRRLMSVTSSDPTSFSTPAVMLEYPYLYPDAANVSRSANEDGTTGDLELYISYAHYKGFYFINKVVD